MRYWFGNSPSDFVVAPGAQHELTPEMFGYAAVLVPGARLWAYDTGTGARITDLLDDQGAMVTEITANGYGRIPRFRGPDSVQQLLLGQAEDEFDGVDDPPELHKWIVASTEWPAVTAALDTRVTALEDGAGTGPDPGEVVATSHPLMWGGEEVTEDRISPHVYWNDEGRGQTITSIRAQAAVASGQLTVTVYTVDPDTDVHTPVGAVTLTPTTARSRITSDAPVSADTGLTVGVERGTEADEVTRVTVQVMIR
ncbi:hypothetical protein [Nocardiopsis synnemataformans]|uniref:hypothetical protein n=1 Tax=Nocardiopsis synnemataformans TaxID=61305 RepID=UPI003EBCBCA5